MVIETYSDENYFNYTPFLLTLQQMTGIWEGIITLGSNRHIYAALVSARPSARVAYSFL